MFRKKVKKLLALTLSAAMVLSAAACGNKEQNTTTPTPAPSKTPDVTGPVAANDGVAPHEGSTPRTITIGTWWDQYYDSTHTSIYDDPNIGELDVAQRRFDNLKRIEQKYNVRIEYVNLTWDGIMESINTSIMAGTPDCDLYEVDLQFGIPAVLNGYATALEDFLPEDSDVFTDQVVTKYLNIMGDEKNYLFKGNATNTDGVVLGFNMDMIEEANLENPQDLWDRGEWTWSVFLEYLRKLTVDRDKDNNMDVYGYAGWHTNTLNMALLSNGASIAAGTEQTLTSTAAIEALDLLYQIWQIDKTAVWDSADWDINTFKFADGKAAFWNTQHWIQQGHTSAETGFEIGIVPFPIGPSGSKETNKTIKSAGSYYMIPTGTERPELVYQVFYELTNWYEGDVELRDNTEWAENMMETERNYQYLYEISNGKEQLELWDVSKVVPSYNLVREDAEFAQTAAQIAEENKLLLQDWLDTYFK